MQPSQIKAVESLLDAYRAGYFPMGDNRRGGPINWYNPDLRGIIPLEVGAGGLHIPRRLMDRVRSRRFHITTDEAFVDVMRACAAPRPPPGEQHSWIDERVIAAYTLVHQAGHAHSIEAWLTQDSHRVLVGGLYGVHIGAAFFAESKFHNADRGGTDASKVCLFHLTAHLRRRGFKLLDVQFWNPHLDQFGCIEIPRDQYLEALKSATAKKVAWQPFDPETNTIIQPRP